GAPLRRRRALRRRLRLHQEHPGLRRRRRSLLAGADARGGGGPPPPRPPAPGPGPPGRRPGRSPRPAPPRAGPARGGGPGGAPGVEYVGLPEAQLNLAHAVVYLATAPKSNSAMTALGAAMADVRERRAGPVPSHLRDASYQGARHLGHGEGYVYPHDAPAGW